MSAIVVEEQPVLSLARTVQITANGIRYRLFRSMVTVVVVAVAVAFLMNILTESLLRKALGRNAGARVTELRQAAIWASNLTQPGTTEEILARLATSRPGGPAFREAARLGALDAKQLETLHAGARSAMTHLRFFARLDYGHRRALVRDARGTDIFDALQGEAALSRFKRRLRAFRSVRLPTAVADLERFLADWPRLEALVERVRRGRARAIKAVATALKGKRLMDALAEADGWFGEAVRRAGFEFDPATARSVAREARRMLDMRTVESTIGSQEMRRAIAGYLDLLPDDVNIPTLWGLLRKRNGAEWFVARQKELAGPAASFAPQRLVELARVEAEVRALSRVERLGGYQPEGFFGSERMGWLVFASMLVCVVGISNSMLMSVTERFREIATLKCLGALDGFIMGMFVLEALFLGAVGGAMGAALGAGLGTARMLAVVGSLAIRWFPFGQVLFAMLGSAVLGVVLAAVASVYPSLKAARLAPMEAMRIQ